MSVIITSIDMPKNCDECLFIQRGYPDWCDLPMGQDIYDDQRRPEWCPLSEVEPVKTGKWYDWSFTAFDGYTVGHRVCSVCGYKRDDDNLDKDTNYCPNCGARMSERNEE